MNGENPWGAGVTMSLAGLAAIVVLTAVGCDEGTSQIENTNDPPPRSDEGPPILKNLLVAFAPYDAGTGRAGAFDFAAAAFDAKVFLEFGAVVTGPEGPKVLPTFEYRVAPDAQVLSPIDGIVVGAIYQANTGDYELWLGASANSAWIVSVDHVKGLTVAEGESVSAGQNLGLPGPWSPDLGRTELMITDSANLAHCPFEFFDPLLIDLYRQQVIDHLADWETFKSDVTIFDEASMVEPGCNDWTYPA